MYSFFSVQAKAALFRDYKQSFENMLKENGESFSGEEMQKKENCTKVIIACCVIHNYLCFLESPVPVDWLNGMQPMESPEFEEEDVRTRLDTGKKLQLFLLDYIYTRI